MSRAIADVAMLGSQPTSTASSEVAGVHVVAVMPAGRADVFNLTVEGAHEYFAEGVLVSNCDALRYDCINWHWETTSRFDHKSLARVSDDMPEPRARELTGKTKPGRSRRLIGGGR